MLILSRRRLTGLLAVPLLSASLVLGPTPTLAQGTLDQSRTAADPLRTSVATATYGFAWKSPTKGAGHGVNKPPAGATVAVTFTLDTTVRKGALLASGWPKARRVDCATKEPIAGTQWLTRPFGARGLTRSGATYTYAWHVRPEWGDGKLACRELRIKLTDGTTHSAYYRFGTAGSSPTNHAPLAGDDATLISFGHTPNPATGNLLDNDSDQDGDSLTVTNAGSFVLTNGTLVIASDGAYSYTASAAAQSYVFEHGALTDHFTYHVSDGHGGSDYGEFQVTMYGDPV